MKNTKRIMVWGVLVAALGTFTVLACLGVIPDRAAGTTVKIIMTLALWLCFFELTYSSVTFTQDDFPVATWKPGHNRFVSFSLITVELLLIALCLANIWNSVLTWRAVIATIIICAATDSAAFLVGKLFGRHHPRCLARVSPGKTIEGFLGGYLGGIGAGFLITGPLLSHYCYDASMSRTFILLCPLAAIIGDLAASFIKRFYGLKDFNEATLQIPILKWLERPLESHGGYLDRFDSIIWGLALLSVLSIYFYFV